MKVFKHECKANPQYVILHVKAKKLDSNDFVHYLWTTIDYPTIVTAHTSDPSVKPDIQWNDCWNNSITFKPQVETIAAFVLTSVYEYNDPDDNRDATAAKNFIKDVLPMFSWKLESCSNGTGSPDAVFTTNSTALNSTSAKISIEVLIFIRFKTYGTTSACTICVLLKVKIKINLF